MTDLIFLRPYALILFIPLLILFYFSLSKKTRRQNYITENILTALTKYTPKERIIKSPFLLLILSSIAIFALAGPAIPKKTTLAKNTMHAIAILAMDTSMYADDLKPSRLAVTKSKIDAFLSENSSANIALIAFAGSAHIISPFTDDHNTLLHFIDALNPSVMPESGFNSVEAIK